MQLGLKQVLSRFMFWVHDFTMGLYLDNVFQKYMGPKIFAQEGIKMRYQEFILRGLKKK